MPQARGRKGQVLIDFETDFGVTPVAPNGIQVPFNSCGVKASQRLIEDGTIRNTRNPGMPTYGRFDVAGPMVVPLDKVGIGHWLKAMFGAPQTSGAGPYTHAFKPGDTQPSLTLERGYTDIGAYLLYNGVKISRCTIPLGGDAEAVMNLEFTGAKETAGAASFDATPLAITLAKFGMPSLAIQEGGVAIAIVTGGEIALDFGLDGDQYAIGNGGTRADIPEGLVQATGNIKAFFKDLVLYNKAVNGTESSLKMTWTEGAHSLEILMPELKFERDAPVIDGPKGVSVNLPFRGYYENNADTTAIKATLINAQATY